MKGRSPRATTFILSSIPGVLQRFGDVENAVVGLWTINDGLKSRTSDLRLVAECFGKKQQNYPTKSIQLRYLAP